MSKTWWAARRAAKRERLRVKLRIEHAGLILEVKLLEQLFKSNAEGVSSCYVDQFLKKSRRIGQIEQHLKEI